MVKKHEYRHALFISASVVISGANPMNPDEWRVDHKLLAYLNDLHHNYTRVFIIFYPPSFGMDLDVKKEIIISYIHAALDKNNVFHRPDFDILFISSMDDVEMMQYWLRKFNILPDNAKLISATAQGKILANNCGIEFESDTDFLLRRVAIY